jgi:hypothetical protein
VTLVLKPSGRLAEAQRRAVETDYGMRRGVMPIITVRRALEDYLHARLHVPLRDGTAPRRALELVGVE